MWPSGIHTHCPVSFVLRLVLLSSSRAASLASTEHLLESFAHDLIDAVFEWWEEYGGWWVGCVGCTLDQLWRDRLGYGCPVGHGVYLCCGVCRHLVAASMRSAWVLWPSV